MGEERKGQSRRVDGVGFKVSPALTPEQVERVNAVAEGSERLLSGDGASIMAPSAGGALRALDELSKCLEAVSKEAGARTRFVEGAIVYEGPRGRSTIVPDFIQGTGWSLWSCKITLDPETTKPEAGLPA